MKGRMAAYYMRLNSLIAPLKLRIDNKEFSIVTASKLSYLSEAAQEQVDKLLCQGHYNVNTLKIDALRKADKKGPLSLEQTHHILFDTETRKNAPPVVKVKPKVYQKFFSPDTSVKEMEDTIEKALALYFESQSGREST